MVTSGRAPSSSWLALMVSPATSASDLAMEMASSRLTPAMSAAVSSSPGHLALSPGTHQDTCAEQRHALTAVMNLQERHAVQHPPARHWLSPLFDSNNLQRVDS